MKRLLFLLALCAGALCMCGAPARARYWHWAEFTAPRHDGEYLHLIRTDRVRTPALPFAKPLAGGPLKVLFIIPKAGVQTRDVVELWQRLDLEFEAVTINGGDDLCDDFPLTTAVAGESTPEKEVELSEKLNKRYDAIVLANCMFDMLPAESQAKILRAVRSGTGLLGVYEQAKPKKVTFFQPLDPPVTGQEILRGSPLAGLPYFDISEAYPRDKAANDTITAARFGKGRIAWLNYGKAAHIVNSWYAGDCLGRPAIPTPQGYDAAMSIAARALLWAARYDPTAQVHLDLEDGAAIAQAAWPQSFHVAIMAHRDGVPNEFAVEAHLVRADGAYAATTKAKAIMGNATAPCAISFPVPPRGPAFLYVVARDDKGAVIDWWASTIRVTGAAELAVATDGAVLAPGQDGKITATVKGNLPPGARLRAEVADAYGRIAWRGEVPAAAEVALSVPTQAVCGRYAHAQVQLVAGNTVLDTAPAELFIRTELGRAFPNLMWGHAGIGPFDWQARGYVNDLVGKHLMEAGFNVGMIFSPREIRHSVWAAQAFSRTDAHWMYYIDFVNDSDVIANSRLRMGFDPANRAEVEQRLEEQARAVRPYGTWVYSLGDENNYFIHDDLQPREFAAYRAYLRGEYGDDIAKLNTAWGTKYASFDAVEAKPVGTTSIAPGYDLTNFWERVYAEMHHWKRDAIRRGDPDAQVGAEGSFNGDLEYTISKLDWWAPYEDRMGNALLRFWMPGDSLRGNWWGSYSMNRSGPKTPWHQLATGSVNSSLFFIATLAAEGMLAPDAGFAGFFNAWEEELREINETPGPLIRAAQPIDDGVGIFWTRRSELANEKDARFGSALSTQNELLILCDRLGVNAKFFTENHLITGKITPANTPILLIPVAKAITDDFAPALDAYVRAGGVVVADVAPDLRDRHCAEVAPGRLLQIFGVSADGAPKEVKAPVQFAEIPLNGRTLSLTTGECLLDGSLRAGEAQPLAKIGDTPILFARKYGTGTAILLNFSLYHAVLQARADKPRTTPAGDFLLALLSLVDIRPEFTPLPGLPWNTVRRFRLADATLVGLDQWMPDTVTPTVFPVGRDRLVHLLRRDVAPDAAGQLSLSADRPDNVIFAVLPTAKREVKVDGPARGKAGEMPAYTLSLLVGGKPLAQSLLRIDVLDPAGKVLPAHRDFVMSGERRSFTWPIACNLAPGTYTVQVTELLSGTVGRRTVAVGK